MTTKTLFVLAIMGCCALATLYEMQADFVATNDPLVPNGIVEGHIKQVYDSTNTGTEDSESKRLIVYSKPAVLNEVLVESTSLRYRFCDTACNTDATNDKVQPLNWEMYTATGVSVGLLKEATPNKACNIKKAYFTSDNVISKVIFTNDKVWTFSNVQATIGTEKFAVPAKCPQPVCNAVMDIAIAMDASSSISSKDFETMKNFVNNIINMFDLGEDKVMIGVLTFDKATKLIHSLSADKNSLTSKVTSDAKRGSGTRTGLGIQFAFTNIFQNMPQDRAARKAQKVVITITDGAEYANGGYNIYDAMDDYGDKAIFVALGIGKLKNAGLEAIATTDDLFMLVDNFKSLSGILDTLVSKTCSQIPESNLCGDNCKGFCGCGNECICPECGSDNKCIESKCNSEYEGCVLNEVECSESNQCYNGVCNPSTGTCEYSAISMPSEWENDNCLLKWCNNQSGWTKKNVDCPEQKCKILSTDSTKNGCCVYTDKECEHRVCYTSECDIYDGECKYTEVKYTSDNKCINYVCENDQKVAKDVKCEEKNCKSVTCDPAKGCVYKDLELDKNLIDDGVYDPCFNYKCDPETGKWMKDGERLDGCNWCTLENENGKVNADTCTTDLKCRKATCYSEDSFTNGCGVEYIGDAACEREICPDGCGNDGDTCKQGYCNVGENVLQENLKCAMKALNGCTACTANPCPAVTCMDVKCVVTDETSGKEDARVCLYGDSTIRNETFTGRCSGDDKCKVYTCSDNVCGTQDAVYTGDGLTTECMTAECVNNEWVIIDPCDTGDACYPSTCVNGVCVKAPLCAHSNCTLETCSDGVCDYSVSKSCQAVDVCHIAMCDISTDSCVDVPNPCEPKPCYDVTCDASKSFEERCVYTAIECKGSSCFPGVCDTQTGQCTNTTKCGAKSDFCNEEVCTGDDARCVIKARKSPKKVTSEKEGCFRYVCSISEEKWNEVIIPEAFLDSCGDCYQNFNQYYSGSHANIKCLAGMTVTEFSATMGGVAIAGVVVAVLIGIAVVATTGFYGTKELIRLATQGSDNGMHNNPLYEEDGVAMENPMFDGNN